MKGRVLIIAGSDSGGGAGIQADIKAVTALGGFAMTAITALTAQNTLGVHGVLSIDPAFVVQQMRVVLDDIGADCLKTGMLHSPEIIAAVADTILAAAPAVPLVVDPVMVAKGGARLLEASAHEALVRRLLPLASVLTPNAPEAGALTGIAVTDAASQQAAAFNWFVNVLTPVDGRVRGVFAAGNLPPADLQLRDDLRSRLGWGHVFQLHALDENQRRAVLRRAADARGVFLSDEVIAFMLSRFSRDLSSLMQLLGHLDQYALRTQRSVTVPLIKAMLEDI